MSMMEDSKDIAEIMNIPANTASSYPPGKDKSLEP